MTSEVLEIAKPNSKLVREAEDLKVYQMAFSLSLEIHHASLSFPKIEQFALADQMRRASKSICANLVEGFAKQSFSRAEFRRFFTMSLGSAAEMRVWIDYACALEYLEKAKAAEWKDLYKQIIRMLQSLLSRL